MSVLFLEYPPCSTCQKAKRWLEDNGVAYTARHIKTDNPTKEELTAWIARSGLPIKRFFNTSGLVYKAMSEEEQISLLASDGMLVKRPLAVTEERVIPGFRPAEWEALKK